MPTSILGLNRAHDGETMRCEAHFSSLPDIDLEQPLILQVTITKLRHDLYDAHVSGKATTQVDCHRCLKRFSRSINLDFHTVFSDDPQDDEWPIERNDIDLTEPVRQEILFLTPAQLICESSCPGVQLKN